MQRGDDEKITASKFGCGPDRGLNRQPCTGPVPPL